MRINQITKLRVRNLESINNKRVYTVIQGENLYDIAKKFYDDGQKWSKIYKLNKSVIGNNLNNIVAGTRLVIPDD